MAYRRECWCGNTLAAGSALTTVTQCRMTCAGNSTEYCGSGGKLSLYTRAPVTTTLISSSSTLDPSSSVSSSETSSVSSSATPTPTGPIHNPGNDVYGFSGCFTEATTGRALSVLNGANDMTINKCLGICSSYEYAGVEYGFVPP